MVIGNGYICKTEDQVLSRILQNCDGEDVRIAPLPMVVNTMTYYISNIGEMFGCQKYKDFYLVKPLKIERRYKIGASIRVAEGNNKYSHQYMQYIMYWAFVCGEYNPNVKLNFKDNNVYNYQLSNIEVQKEDNGKFRDNLYRFMHIYKSHFSDVARYARIWNAKTSIDDCKDLASKAFYELCENDYTFINEDQFIGTWKRVVGRRSIDFGVYNNRFDSLFYEDGTERYGTISQKETICLSSLKRPSEKSVLKLWMQGYTPTEISEMQGCNRSTVSAHLTRSIQFLKKYYKRDIDKFYNK